MIYSIDMPARRGTRKQGSAGRPKLFRDRVRILLDLEREDADAVADMAAEMGTSRADLLRRAIRELLAKTPKEKR